MQSIDNPVRVAIAIVEQNGQFLVGVRPESVPLAGLAEFPGGKVHDDETAAAAAVRECREETGLQVVIDREFFSTITVTITVCLRFSSFSAALWAASDQGQFRRFAG